MLKIVWQAILESKSIVLASHVNPDCDTLGCALAMFDVLRNIGKEAYLFNATEKLPNKLRFLPNFEHISSQLPNNFDTLILFDCAKFERVNLNKSTLKQKIINIDHHLTNSNFGDINLVSAEFSSACMVVFEMLKANSIKISSKAATCLYAGNIDDTGFFAYGNINSKTFMNSAELIEFGADPVYISKQLKQSVPLARFRLKEHVMQTVDLLKNGRVGLVVIMQNDLKRSGAKREDTEDIINIIRDLVSVELGIMILEEEDGSFKISLRSKNFLDVSKIALKFGGGGHFGAAGFESKITNTHTIISMVLNEFDEGIMEYEEKSK
ncbi:MAG: bifunctional oligoribonuclease/PAP phosphatase NrnA [Campylobacteraceae bacterium]|jgi:phosphoesterase RecJ-like protein|nr:bifunctional oligoribonuclease/PAP phosphatase NrnA [Campylobacteraceae bacterium]